MNEQLRQRAQEIADEHGNDAYSVAFLLARQESENRWLKQQWRKEIDNFKRHKNKLKAEAVRESIIFADSYAERACDTGETWINRIYKYANKLENQK
ncbi:MAG: hypothetical protein ACPHUL_00380 [Marinomonas gallaica]